MPKMYITRREVFSASHRLWNPQLSEEENYRLYNKCAGKNGHGHNYVLEVTIAGPIDGTTGYVCDFREVRQIIRSEIIEHVDHKHLNYDVDFMKGINPTAENIVRVFWNILRPKFRQGALHTLRLHETENNIVEYRGEE